jgi:hypothetical protein
MLWVGAKPRPAPFPYITKHKFKYICECTYNKEQVRICWLAECFKGFVLWEGPGVKPRGLQYFYKANLSHSNKRHVAPKHWATCPLLIRFHTTRVNSLLVHEHPTKMCHIIPLPHQHDGTALHVAVRTVRTGTVSIPNFSLFDLAVRMRYLLPYGLRLTKKLYHRNQEDEPDAMVLVSSDSEHFHF